MNVVRYITRKWKVKAASLFTWMCRRDCRSVCSLQICKYPLQWHLNAKTTPILTCDFSKHVSCCSYRGSYCADLHRYIVAGLAASAGMSDVLFKLLQTVQHCLTQQLASSGCSSDAAFTWKSPQLLHAGAQAGQVATDLLKVQRKCEGQESNG